MHVNKRECNNDFKIKTNFNRYFYIHVGSITYIDKKDESIQIKLLLNKSKKNITNDYQYIKYFFLIEHIPFSRSIQKTIHLILFFISWKILQININSLITISKPYLIFSRQISFEIKLTSYPVACYKISVKKKETSPARPINFLDLSKRSFNRYNKKNKITTLISSSLNMNWWFTKADVC